MFMFLVAGNASNNLKPSVTVLSETWSSSLSQPNIFYIWQKQFFENGATAFTSDKRSQKRVEESKIQQLEAKLVRKHEVLSELLEEHIKLKKELGEL